MIDNEQSPIKYFKTRSNPSWELQSWKWDVLTFFFFFSFCPLYLRRIPRAVERRGRGKGRRRGRGKGSGKCACVKPNLLIELQRVPCNLTGEISWRNVDERLAVVSGDLAFMIFYNSPWALYGLVFFSISPPIVWNWRHQVLIEPFLMRTRSWRGQLPLQLPSGHCYLLNTWWRISERQIARSN